MLQICTVHICNIQEVCIGACTLTAYQNVSKCGEGWVLLCCCQTTVLHVNKPALTLSPGTACGSSSCRPTTRPWKWRRWPSRGSPGRSRPLSSAWTSLLTPPSIFFLPKTGWLFLLVFFCVCVLSYLYFFHFLSVIFLPVPAAPPCLCPYDSPCLSYWYRFMFYAFSNFHSRAVHGFFTKLRLWQAYWAATWMHE